MWDISRNEDWTEKHFVTAYCAQTALLFHLLWICCLSICSVDDRCMQFITLIVHRCVQHYRLTRRVVRALVYAVAIDVVVLLFPYIFIR